MGLQQILERVPAFAGVEPQVLEKMASYATTRSFRRGEHLWQAGDDARTFTVIRNGLVKLVRPGPRGRSAICGLFGPPETVGDVAVLKGIPYPTSAVVATEQAHVIAIPRELVLEGTRRSPQLGVSIACALHNKLSALHVKIEVLSAGSVEARLATLLLKLYDQFGDDFEDGTSTIPVALSRRELSDLVSTSFETAIRVMTRWEREKVVDTEPTGFTVHNLAQLREVAGNPDSVESQAS